MFSNRTSKCRKLHNILNSVIIIDEAQQIPLDYLEPCIEVMKELVNNYNCTIVLCTATQPSIYKSKTFNKGIEKITEIVDNPKEYFNILKRVNIEYLGKVSNDELISYMDCNISELIITNTKKEARELGNKINGYVLTTDLCSQHRKDKLEKIRYNLRNGVPCKVVSTSLIEAGVDISFPVVYRAVTGVDSIGQGAGRCNREGELSNLGKVYLYTPENGYPEIGLIKPMAQITEKYLNENRDILSIEVVDEYFKELYTRYSDNLDKKKIIQRLTMGIKNNDINVQFKDISDDFKLIDEHSYTILVPYNQEAVELIAKFKNNQNLKTMRKLQKYSVQVKSYELTHFIEKGIIVEIKEGVYELTNNENYGEMGIEIKEDYYII
ncbi:MAG: CRISPR-associated helicase/endonuclease Cas3 [bacterium]